MTGSSVFREGFEEVLTSAKRCVVSTDGTLTADTDVKIGIFLSPKNSFV
jgi:hypothetical protein